MCVHTYNVHIYIAICCVIYKTVFVLKDYSISLEFVCVYTCVHIYTPNTHAQKTHDANEPRLATRCETLENTLTQILKYIASSVCLCVNCVNEYYPRECAAHASGGEHDDDDVDDECARARRRARVVRVRVAHY